MNLAITGATSGIGEYTLKNLVLVFNQLFILARNKQKAENLLRELKIDSQQKCIFIYCDLTDMDSVVNAAQELSNHCDQLDVLINNAGGIFKQKEFTKDQFETSLAANHLGHFLLTQKLMPLLLKAKGSKVINVSSEAHRAARVKFTDLNYREINYSSFGAYANVKLFNILFTKSLVDKYGSIGLKSYALHPGVVKTNFGSDTSGVFAFLWKLASPFMISPEDGAKTSIFLAKSELPESFNGSYFKNSKAIQPSSSALSKNMRVKLWTKCEELLADWL
ncbi:NAD(P)-dependent dehydrogenase, short-chain alcohol dehydrogenase family [Belliella buryatensis]|uniref:NAD(P)-dependent dehydrogenase, short-chain alcohol dehydrogenase family n=1 Tax=Belliella buryatensis TaxID=1500549 RepID=A0A239D791_9BACT|nr:SDR family NAD(P)-dependent oxidoreductase [Belliella buryatensis]SNS28376.1 NAD(P)-dependent dehydrogenase, short-chain alcohol dehydrogenase family [Belliella buryatensis]